MGAAKIDETVHQTAVASLGAELQRLNRLYEEWLGETEKVDPRVLEGLRKDISDMQESIAVLQGRRNIEVEPATEHYVRSLIDGPRWSHCGVGIAVKLAEVAVQVLD